MKHAPNVPLLCVNIQNYQPITRNLPTAPILKYARGTRHRAVQLGWQAEKKFS